MNRYLPKKITLYFHTVEIVKVIKVENGIKKNDKYTLNLTYKNETTISKELDLEEIKEVYYETLKNIGFKWNPNK